MRINLDKCSFEAPQGFEDITNYTFKDRKKQELLTVTFGARPPEARDLASLMAVRRANLDVTLPGVAQNQQESDGRLDGLQARLLSFQFEDSGNQFRERWAVALPAPDTYIQISYVAPEEDKASGKTFQHILESVVPARKEPPAASPAGFKRQWAGRMSVDVPITLFPPATYQFVSRDGTGTITLTEYEALARTPTEIEEKAEDSSRGATTGDTERQHLSGPNGDTTIISYPLSANDAALPAQEMIRRAHVSLSDGTKVYIFTRAPQESAGMQTTLKQLVDSLEPSR